MDARRCRQNYMEHEPHVYERDGSPTRCMGEPSPAVLLRGPDVCGYWNGLDAKPAHIHSHYPDGSMTTYPEPVECGREPQYAALSKRMELDFMDPDRHTAYLCAEHAALIRHSEPWASDIARIWSLRHE